jgi:hypothetical protein
MGRLRLDNRDRDVLRRLAEQQAEIAALPVHPEKAELWRRLNQLEPVRPLLWITELPWHEMNADDELTLQTTDPWCQEIETGLRRLLYQWNHLPGDMVVSGHLSSPLAIQSTGFGIWEDVDVVRTDEASGVVSRRFHRQIVDPEDVQKIKMPRVTHDEGASDENYERMCTLFGDVLPVVKVGKKGAWFAPWDELVRWWGVQEALMDLILRPEMVNAVMAHLVDAYIYGLDQWEALGLLTRNDDSVRVGSGGYGYTDELPGDGSGDHLLAGNLWGCATAQIFSGVSPEMHWEFALRHEMRWLERWGLTYYGCCEPLEEKMDILRRIPNLRKVSMSPWVDVGKGAEEIGTDYVFSYKPSPAIFAEDRWRPELARRALCDVLDRARGCRIEIIMKDISTVRYEPRRLWEWARMAKEVVEEYA